MRSKTGNITTRRQGYMITGLGVLAISPDGLLLKLISADVLLTTYWRGLLFSSGMVVVLIAYYRSNVISAFLSIGKPGLWVMVLYCIGNLAFVFSINHTAVANTLFIISATPLFAAIIAWIMFGDIVPWHTGWAIIATAFGITIICLGKGIMPGAWQGNLAGLLTALTLAASFTIISRFSERDLLPAMALGGFLTAMLLESFVSPSQITGNDMFYLLIMGLILLPVASSLLFMGPRYISPAEVGLLLLLESVLGPIWVWLVLGEYPGNAVLVGGVIVFITLIFHAGYNLYNPDSSR